MLIAIQISYNMVLIFQIQKGFYVETAYHEIIDISYKNLVLSDIWGTDKLSTVIKQHNQRC